MKRLMVTYIYYCSGSPPQPSTPTLNTMIIHTASHSWPTPQTRLDHPRRRKLSMYRSPSGNGCRGQGLEVGIEWRSASFLCLIGLYLSTSTLGATQISPELHPAIWRACLPGFYLGAVPTTWCPSLGSSQPPAEPLLLPTATMLLSFALHLASQQEECSVLSNPCLYWP